MKALLRKFVLHARDAQLQQKKQLHWAIQGTVKGPSAKM